LERHYSINQLTQWIEREDLDSTQLCNN